MFILKLEIPPVGEELLKIRRLGPITIPLNGINVVTVLMTWAVMLLIVIFSWVSTRKMEMVPQGRQSLVELYVEGFDKLCEETLGSRRRGRLALPYIGTLFLFLLISNWIGIIPGAEEPTRDLNTCLGFGIISFFVSHTAAIKVKGLSGYVGHYFEPAITIGKVKIPNVIMFPINLVGELGKLISHSFRLFGNILGGSIIIAVVSGLTRYFIWPIGLSLFFGLFIGAIQAFVFTMLALVYIAVLIE